VNQVMRPTSEGLGPSLRPITLSYQSLQILAAGVDVCALIISAVLGFAAYRYYIDGAFSRVDDGVGAGAVCGILFVILVRAQRLYRRDVLINPAQWFKRLWMTLALAYLGLINLMFLLKVGEKYSRGSMILFGILAIIIVTLSRVALAGFSAAGVQRGFIAGRKAVVIGEAAELERLPAFKLGFFGTEEVARVGVGRSDKGRGLSEKGHGQVANAIALARELRAAEFVLMIPWGHDRLIAEIGELLRVSPLPVKLLPDETIRNFVGRYSQVGIDPVLAVEIQRAPLRRWERLVKRSIDLGLSVGAVVLLSPLLAFTALAVKLDSKGPALFRQRRVGFDNREFVIFKFRTMKTLEDGDVIVQASRGDARVTRLGSLLRRASIDELPQLFNVIRGDMSLVGPRPHAVAHHDQYSAEISSYALRHHVKPGLTGLAQMRGLRGETRQLAQMERRVEQDLDYINHWSLPLDLKIMAQTCLVLLRQEVY
jgi:putative colanic acid biosysnthesis UDP-glucose lipid carrier transferase